MHSIAIYLKGVINDKIINILINYSRFEYSVLDGKYQALLRGKIYKITDLSYYACSQCHEAVPNISPTYPPIKSISVCIGTAPY